MIAALLIGLAAMPACALLWGICDRADVLQFGPALIVSAQSVSNEVAA